MAGQYLQEVEENQEAFRILLDAHRDGLESLLRENLDVEPEIATELVTGLANFVEHRIQLRELELRHAAYHSGMDAIAAEFPSGWNEAAAEQPERPKGKRSRSR